VRKTRHSQEEIAAKLRRAGEMAAQGKLQNEIARALGISVMTYHRWRKAAPRHEPVAEPTGEFGRAGQTNEQERSARIRELELENSRLRRLVADLMLEKVKLQEMIERRHTPRSGTRAG
jgi:putative transposase